MTEKQRDSVLAVIQRYIRVNSAVSSHGARLRADVALSHAMSALEDAAGLEERAAIVVWLLKDIGPWLRDEREEYAVEFAAAIEAGEHLK